ncbi:MAG: hypothetical protein HXY40_18090 [Chloroflexi bacterium]|nr:hypothetical protein [Chloroflexota bacterium]
MSAQSTTFAEFYGMMIVAIASSKPGRHWEEVELAEAVGLTPEQFVEGLHWAQKHQMLSRTDEDERELFLH